jgi:hypothetical protein
VEARPIKLHYSLERNSVNLKTQMILRVLLGLALPIAAAAAQGQTYTCLAASDSTTIVDRDWIVALVTGSDQATVTTRTAYNLPSTTANKVTVVGSGSTCNSAGAAFHAAVAPGTPAVSRTLTVIKVGTTRYVVQDTSYDEEGHSVIVVFDKNWVKLSEWDS